MANWSSRLFFFGMVAFFLYVIMIGDGPKWYSLFTKKGGAANVGGLPSLTPPAGFNIQDATTATQFIAALG